MSEQEVRNVVFNWLQDKSYQLNEKMGDDIEEIALYRGGISGNVGYYLVMLDRGWLILPADTDFWPVQTFGSGIMSIKSFEKSLWHHVTSFSVDSSRQTRKGSSPNTSIRPDIANNNAAWDNLMSRTFQRGSSRIELPDKHEIRVAPFLGVEKYWGQAEPFNKLTTYLNLVRKYPAFFQNLSNEIYSVGCVALASAQIMQYILTNTDFYDNANNVPLHEPGGIYGYNNINFLIYRDWTQLIDPSGGFPNYLPSILISTDMYKHPGDYDWESMSTVNLNDGVLTTSKINVISDEIAPLLHDIGIQSYLSYKIEETGGFFDRKAFLNMGFQHASMIYTSPLDGNSFYNRDRNNAVNTNLDLGLPVGVSFSVYNAGQPQTLQNRLFGHAAVIDGYGFATIVKNPHASNPKIDYSIPSIS